MAKKAKKKVLLHVCCAPCATYVNEWLVKNGWNVTGFFYNPNIHPYQEYERRFNTVKLFAAMKQMKMVYLNSHDDIEGFLTVILHKKDKRCLFCYLFRLYQAAAYAKEHGFPYFTTTLLASPYQKHDFVKQAGRIMGNKFGVKFLYHDWRKDWDKSVEMSKKMNLYRQNYCGCVLSEKERFCKG